VLPPKKLLKIADKQPPGEIGFLQVPPANREGIQKTGFLICKDMDLYFKIESRS
jgi:hypothetical protein